MIACAPHILRPTAHNSCLQMLVLRVQACQYLSLQAALGQEEAERAAQAAMAAATAVMQGKRVEILVPPQAAAWLQVCLRLPS